MKKLHGPTMSGTKVLNSFKALNEFNELKAEIAANARADALEVLNM
jgi:hypothetical protein